MSGYDPKRPRRATAADEPAPVDALIDLSAGLGVPGQGGVAPATKVAGRAVAAADRPAEQGRPAVSAVPVEVTPVVEPVAAPSELNEDDVSRIVLALIGAAGLLGVVVVGVLRRRRRNRRRA